jgi:hypothetical protein
VLSVRQVTIHSCLGSTGRSNSRIRTAEVRFGKGVVESKQALLDLERAILVVASVGSIGSFDSHYDTFNRVGNSAGHPPRLASLIYSSASMTKRTDDERHDNQYIHFYIKRRTEIGRNTCNSQNRNPGVPRAVRKH